MEVTIGRDRYLKLITKSFSLLLIMNPSVKVHDTAINPSPGLACLYIRVGLIGDIIYRFSQG